MSNFLEHLPDKRVLLEVLEECRQALRPGGTLMIGNAALSAKAVAIASHCAGV